MKTVYFNYMKKLLSTVAIVIVIGLLFYVWQTNQRSSDESNKQSSENAESPDLSTAYPQTTEVIAENLDTPWEMVFLQDGSILVTERKGTVRLINATGKLRESPVGTIGSVREIGEGGLLGMALHPDFEDNNFVYFYYTYSGDGNNTLNRVVRFTYKNGTMTDEEIILDAIPGANNHNGGRIAFGPDGFLYITTGDAQEPSLAQNTQSLAGKILRVTADGDSAPGNPFGNEVYSYGHRNSQGLAWDSSGNLWSTEHGRSGITSGFDEVNLIVSGGNYGWPEYEGDETADGVIAPAVHSGARTTWAPGGITVIDSQLYFVGLRGSALYAATVQGNTLGQVTTRAKDSYGRIRVAQKSPEGILYIGTSNRDGRGIPREGDDKIIMIGADTLSP